jgi:copper chaperone
MSNWQHATAQLRITGMTCSGCVNAVKSTLLAINGISDAEVDLERGQAKVTYDPAQSSLVAMTTALGQLGYTAEVETSLLD